MSSIGRHKSFLLCSASLCNTVLDLNWQGESAVVCGTAEYRTSRVVQENERELHGIQLVWEEDCCPILSY